jgi:beta-phosphoglucomutase
MHAPTHHRTTPVEAVVFDFDGVLADTEHLHYRAFCAVAVADGLACAWEVYVRDYMGFDDRDLFRAAYAAAGHRLSPTDLQVKIDAKAAAFLDLILDRVPTYPGMPEIVHALHGRYPLAICSGALLSDIQPILGCFDLARFFSVCVTAEDVPVSKPDPAGYRLAAERLAEQVRRPIAPAACVAIEDTPTGLRAARGAGMQAWAVTHTHPEPLLAGEADRVFSSLSDVSAALLPEV